MKSKSHLVYFETTTILAYLMGEQGRVEACKAAFYAAERGQVRAITSALTIAEVIKLPDGGYLPQDVEDRIEKFFQHAWFTVVQVDRTVAVRARRVARDFGLKPPDAVHVATAIHYNSDYLYTFDGKILAIADKLPGLSVSEPRGQLVLGNVRGP